MVSPQRSNRKDQGQEGTRPRERGSGAALLAMRLGREEGHLWGLTHPAGKRQAPGEAPQASSSGLHRRRPTDGKKEAMPILQGSGDGGSHTVVGEGWGRVPDSGIVTRYKTRPGDWQVLGDE